MKKHFPFLLLVGFMIYFPNSGAAQNYFYNEKYYESPLLWQIGLSAGVMNCLTDLGGNKGPGRRFIKDVNINNTKLCTGAYIQLLYNNTIGARLEGTIGKITAYDSILKNDNSLARYRYKRNLHFRSVIAELSLLGEWYFLSYWMQQKQNKIPQFSPYLLTGISVFHFNPEATLNNQWFYLQPLHTEGQGFREYPDRTNYKCTQLNFPVGFGIRYELSALFNIQLEAVHRFLVTDYLDDVSTKYTDPLLFDQNLDPTQSKLAKQFADRRIEINSNTNQLTGQQRGNSSDKDSYFTISLKFGWILNRQRRW